MKIGVFDSGIGGLTVVKEIMKQLPWSDVVYVGDTARVPYGSRSKKTIVKYALEITKYLLKQNIDILVVACNTVSSVALKEVEKISKVPVIGMIKPACDEAKKYSKNKKIAVIGTKATIGSKSYQRELVKYNLKFYAKACPLFVPIVENDLAGHKIADEAIKIYLDKANLKDCDTMILGCTHYPLLSNKLNKHFKNIKLINCGYPTATLIKAKFDLLKIDKRKKGNLEVWVTDDPQSFIKNGSKILKLKTARLLSLEKLIR